MSHLPRPPALCSLPPKVKGDVKFWLSVSLPSGIQLDNPHAFNSPGLRINWWGDDQPGVVLFPHSAARQSLIPLSHSRRAASDHAVSSSRAAPSTVRFPVRSSRKQLGAYLRDMGPFVLAFVSNRSVVGRVVIGDLAPLTNSASESPEIGGRYPIHIDGHGGAPIRAVGSVQITFGLEKVDCRSNTTTTTAGSPAKIGQPSVALAPPFARPEIHPKEHSQVDSSAEALAPSDATVVLPTAFASQSPKPPMPMPSPPPISTHPGRTGANPSTQNYDISLLDDASTEESPSFMFDHLLERAHKLQSALKLTLDDKSASGGLDASSSTAIKSTADQPEAAEVTAQLNTSKVSGLLDQEGSDRGSSGVGDIYDLLSDGSDQLSDDDLIINALNSTLHQRSQLPGSSARSVLDNSLLDDALSDLSTLSSEAESIPRVLPVQSQGSDPTTMYYELRLTLHGIRFAEYFTLPSCTLYIDCVFPSTNRDPSSLEKPVSDRIVAQYVHLTQQRSHRLFPGAQSDTSTTSIPVNHSLCRHLQLEAAFVESYMARPLKIHIETRSPQPAASRSSSKEGTKLKKGSELGSPVLFGELPLWTVFKTPLSKWKGPVPLYRNESPKQGSPLRFSVLDSDNTTSSRRIVRTVVGQIDIEISLRSTGDEEAASVDDSCVNSSNRSPMLRQRGPELALAGHRPATTAIKPLLSTYLNLVFSTARAMAIPANAAATLHLSMRLFSSTAVIQSPPVPWQQPVTLETGDVNLKSTHFDFTYTLPVSLHHEAMRAYIDHPVIVEVWLTDLSEPPTPLGRVPRLLGVVKLPVHYLFRVHLDNSSDAPQNAGNLIPESEYAVVDLLSGQSMGWIKATIVLGTLRQIQQLTGRDLVRSASPLRAAAEDMPERTTASPQLDTVRANFGMLNLRQSPEPRPSTSEQGAKEHGPQLEVSLVAVIHRACGLRALLQAHVNSQPSRDPESESAFTDDGESFGPLDYALEVGANSFVRLKLCPPYALTLRSPDGDARHSKASFAVLGTPVVVESFTPMFNYQGIVNLTGIGPDFIEWIQNGGEASGEVWHRIPRQDLPHNDSSADILLGTFKIPMLDLAKKSQGIDSVWLAVEAAQDTAMQSSVDSAVQISLRLLSAVPGALQKRDGVDRLPLRTPWWCKMSMVLDRARFVLGEPGTVASRSLLETQWGTYARWIYPKARRTDSDVDIDRVHEYTSLTPIGSAGANGICLSMLDYCKEIDLEMNAVTIQAFFESKIEIEVWMQRCQSTAMSTAAEPQVGDRFIGCAVIDVSDMIAELQRQHSNMKGQIIASSPLVSRGSYPLIDPSSADLKGSRIAVKLSFSLIRPSTKAPKPAQPTQYPSPSPRPRSTGHEILSQSPRFKDRTANGEHERGSHTQAASPILSTSSLASEAAAPDTALELARSPLQPPVPASFKPPNSENASLYTASSLQFSNDKPALTILREQRLDAGYVAAVDRQSRTSTHTDESHISNALSPLVPGRAFNGGALTDEVVGLLRHTPLVAAVENQIRDASSTRSSAAAMGANPPTDGIDGPALVRLPLLQKDTGDPNEMLDPISATQLSPPQASGSLIDSSRFKIPGETHKQRSSPVMPLVADMGASQGTQLDRSETSSAQPCTSILSAEAECELQPSRAVAPLASAHMSDARDGREEDQPELGDDSKRIYNANISTTDLSILRESLSFDVLVIQARHLNCESDEWPISTERARTSLAPSSSPTVFVTFQWTEFGQVHTFRTGRAAASSPIFRYEMTLQSTLHEVEWMCTCPDSEPCSCGTTTHSDNNDTSDSEGDYGDDNGLGHSGDGYGFDLNKHGSIAFQVWCSSRLGSPDFRQQNPLSPSDTPSYLIGCATVSLNGILDHGRQSVGGWIQIVDPDGFSRGQLLVRIQLKHDIGAIVTKRQRRKAAKAQRSPVEVAALVSLESERSSPLGEARALDHGNALLGGDRLRTDEQAKASPSCLPGYIQSLQQSYGSDNPATSLAHDSSAFRALADNPEDPEDHATEKTAVHRHHVHETAQPQDVSALGAAACSPISPTPLECEPLLQLSDLMLRPADGKDLKPLPAALPAELESLKYDAVSSPVADASGGNERRSTVNSLEAESTGLLSKSPPPRLEPNSEIQTVEFRDPVHEQLRNEVSRQEQLTLPSNGDASDRSTVTPILVPDPHDLDADARHPVSAARSPDAVSQRLAASTHTSDSGAQATAIQPISLCVGSSATQSNTDAKATVFVDTGADGVSPLCAGTPSSSTIPSDSTQAHLSMIYASLPSDAVTSPFTSDRIIVEHASDSGDGEDQSTNRIHRRQGILGSTQARLLLSTPTGRRPFTQSHRTAEAQSHPRRDQPYIQGELGDDDRDSSPDTDDNDRARSDSGSDGGSNGGSDGGSDGDSDSDNENYAILFRRRMRSAAERKLSSPPSLASSISSLTSGAYDIQPVSLGKAAILSRLRAKYDHGEVRAKWKTPMDLPKERPSQRIVRESVDQDPEHSDRRAGEHDARRDIERLRRIFFGSKEL
ncbi:uncharacterized protein BJ171DRAFT_496614 [Polychytrium aggregatum]|uniref:uncharacterized protein n=1 Tax=Polychytrium aggregatum TaxID=110093 RepID=UPI0022FF338F|nr:uncharacterized protein BJ171DRAFT_496614 [Polychytrium aggregatum]KAI9206701.1 hypothetical protein BJ171DRAFT_496614 [Polychytrium aggregatum]